MTRVGMVCFAALLLAACSDVEAESGDANKAVTAGGAGTAGAAGASGAGAAGASGAAAGASGAAAGASGGGAAGASGGGAAGASGGGAAGAGAAGTGAAGPPPKLTCEQAAAAESCKQDSGYGCGPPSPKLPDIPWSCSTAATCPMVTVAQNGAAGPTSKDALKCSLLALRDRTPGKLQVFVPFIGFPFGMQMDLEILPDGRVLETTIENKDVCMGRGYRGPVTPKPPEFFESCLAGKGTSDYGCLFEYAKGC